MELLTFPKLSYFQFHALTATITLTFFCIANPSMAAKLQPQSISNVDFVKTSCQVTMYPEICYQTLSAHASTIQTSPRELANAALSVSLNAAQSTTNVVLKLSKEHGLKPGEVVAIADCVETMRDSVDELHQSMKDLRGPDFELKMSNIKTWVSAALTNEDTCLDGIEGKAMNGKIKDTITSNIARVAQLTSNALASSMDSLVSLLFFPFVKLESKA